MIPLTVFHVDEDASFHRRLYVTASAMAVQLTVALVLLMFEEFKSVGVPQLIVVVNDVASLYELDPAEQTVRTWNWYVVPSVSADRSMEVVVMPLIVVQVDEDASFHRRL